MERRQFIKTSCAVIGLAAMGSLMQSCSTMPIVKSDLQENKLAVGEDKFTTTDSIIVRNSKMPFDIFLRKINEQKYEALYLRCTHQEQPLMVSNKSINCPAHGSSFDLDGNVTNAPATEPLLKLKTEIINKTIYITTNF